MGIVYRALDTLLQRIVAVKVISAPIDTDPEPRERFFREARAAGQLSHKNIITIHDLGEHEGQPYLAMEYLTGQDLAAPDDRPAKDEPPPQAGGGVGNLRRPRVRACPWRGPSRHQARQHLPDRQRHGQDRRLRPRPPRDVRSDPQQHDDGHHQLHGARADPRRARRPACGYLFDGRGPLRGAERTAGVRRRFRRVDALQDSREGAGAAAEHRRGVAARGRPDRRPCAGQAARRALSAHERDAPRSGRLPAAACGARFPGCQPSGNVGPARVFGRTHRADTCPSRDSEQPPAPRPQSSRALVYRRTVVYRMQRSRQPSRHSQSERRRSRSG